LVIRINGHRPPGPYLAASRHAYMDIVRQRTRLEPNLGEVHLNAMFILQAAGKPSVRKCFQMRAQPHFDILRHTHSTGPRGKQRQRHQKDE